MLVDHRAMAATTLDVEHDLLDLYRRASQWAIGKIDGATGKLDLPTHLDGWDVRALLNHMLLAQRYFLGATQGEDLEQPNTTHPPSLISDNPKADFEQVRAELIELFSDEAVLADKTIGIVAAFGDFLIHGWDVAKATGQDTTMPPGLAEANYDMIPPFTDDQREGIFGPKVTVADDASVQDKLIAFTGRRP